MDRTSFDVGDRREGKEGLDKQVEPAPHSAGCQRGQTRMSRGEGKLMRGSASGGFPVMSLAKQYRRLYFWLFHKWRAERDSCYFSFREEGDAAGYIGPPLPRPIVLQLRFNCNVCYKEWGHGFGTRWVQLKSNRVLMILLNFRPRVYAIYCRACRVNRVYCDLVSVHQSWTLEFLFFFLILPALLIEFYKL